eukprot:UN12561
MLRALYIADQVLQIKNWHSDGPHISSGDGNVYSICVFVPAYRFGQERRDR